MSLAVLVFLLLTPRALASERLLTRVSDQLVAASDAWREPGFRMQLRIGREFGLDAGTGPRLGGFHFVAEPSLRLSESWSLALGLRYAVVTGTWSGLRWTTTAEANWHPVAGLQLGLGLGYAGLIVDRWMSSTYYDEFDPEIYSCDGRGAVALARLGYLIAVGELFATGPIIEAGLQRTTCKETRWDYNADSMEGFEITYRQHWLQPNLTFAWSFAWR